MDIQAIPIVSVSYNSAELIADLLYSLRKFYRNPVYIIDGSQEAHYKGIEEVAGKFADVQFIHFDYNIHHGPGMAWAINNLGLTGRVLFIDSDVFVLNGGFIEAMNDALQPDMYGVGMVNCVNEGGFDVDYEVGAIKYLHPALMLCNIEEMRRWPLPEKHGAPMTPTMTALHRAGASHLVSNLPWVCNDFKQESTKHYIRHDWQGTVKRTGGYNLDEWHREAQEAATFQALLLSQIPPRAQRVVEVGCGVGTLARAYRAVNPGAHYTGTAADPLDARLAEVFCDRVLPLDFDGLASADFAQFDNTDCWILNEVLEQMRDPWALLRQIRASLAPGGSVVACIPNAQHWMLLAKLGVGDFLYQETGAVPLKQLRWFTRGTIFALFQQCGFQVTGGMPLESAFKLENEGIKASIRMMASSVGIDPELALADALPLRYLVKAVAV